MLSAGDIAIIGFTADDPDQFSFLALADIAAGETIYFTDSGWYADGTLRNTEGTLSWTAPAAIAAGTVITYVAGGSNPGFASAGGSFSLATSGDQITAYQLDGTDMVPLFAVTSDSTAFDATATSSNTTAVPPGLTVGSTAVAVGASATNDFDNVWYGGPTSGDRATLLAAIADAANWSGSDTREAYAPASGFTIDGSGNGDGSGDGEGDTFTYTQSFETEAAGTIYTDTGDAAADHDLVNTAGQAAVDSEVSGAALNGLLAFDATYSTTGGVGLTDGDFVGVTSLASQVGSYTDGVQGYAFSDTDGLMTLTFETLDLTTTGEVYVGLDLFAIPTGYEASDLIQVGVTVDGVTTYLLDTTGQDIDDLALEGVWTTLTATIPASADSLSLFVTVNVDAAAEGAYIDNVIISTDPEAIGGSGPEEPTYTLISAIQGVTDYSAYPNLPVVGTDDRSSYAGQIVTIQAIVTADFQTGDADATDNMAGFYVQEEDADQDGNAATSEGLFIYDPSYLADVKVGDLVTITGTISEFNGLTELTASSVTIDSSNNALPSVTVVEFDDLGVMVDASGGYVVDLEAYEGMLIEVPTVMTVSELYNLDTYGEYVVTEGGRIATYTQNNAPDAAGYDLWLQEVASRSITLDDAISASNPAQMEIIDGNNGVLDGADSFRMGDTITGITGVVGYGFDEFRVMDPTGTYDKVNTATDAPQTFEGNLKIASLNVLNYFTTLNIGSNRTDTGLDPRGANSAEELARQTTKVVNALVAMDADVVGLLEIENSENSETLAYLVDQLNAALGSEVYGYVNTGIVGTDAITCAVIYKIATVIPVGETDIYDDAAFLDPLDSGSALNRPAVTQSFLQIETGETVTVSVNHLKSKGSLSGLAEDADQGDGAGNNNASRTAAAEALADHLATDPTGAGSDNTVIIGDLNSYAQEDPIQAFAAAGYTDLAYGTLGEDAYSYVFDATTGTLDYVLGSDAMTGALSGITEWHINSDEADAVDYNIEVMNSAGTSLFTTRDETIFDDLSAARGSDHDPVIATFQMEADENLVLGTAGNDQLTGDGAANRVLFLGGSDIAWGRGGVDTFDFTATVDNGVRNTIRIRDFAEDEIVTGFTAEDVVTARAVGARLDLVIGEDRDAVSFYGITSLDQITFADDLIG